MKRYLIHHGHGGTFDVVVDGDEQWIEHVTRHNRERFSIEEFKISATGKAFAGQLNAALDRAAKPRS